MVLRSVSNLPFVSSHEWLLLMNGTTYEPFVSSLPSIVKRMKTKNIRSDYVYCEKTRMAYVMRMSRKSNIEFVVKESCQKGLWGLIQYHEPRRRSVVWRTQH